MIKKNNPKGILQGKRGLKAAVLLSGQERVAR
jgi:hypothetical protein